MIIYDYPTKDIWIVKKIKTSSMIPLELAIERKFDITSAMIQLLNLKRVFLGFPTDEVNMHTIKFVGIFTLYNLLRVSYKYL